MKDDGKHSAKKLALSRADELFPSLLSAEQKESINRVKAKKRKNTNALIVSGGYVAATSDATKDIFTGVEDDFDIIAHMRNAEDPITGTLRDLRIDDRDLRGAKNFYDYAFNIIGKDANPPWARQLWTGAMLFGEICPCCSNKKWLDINNVPKDYPSKELPEHLMFLENGVCPKCKRGKWELIKEFGLKNYIQLVNVLGQRSGKSSSCATYCSYVTHRYLKFPNLSTMTKNMQASTELTGTFVSLSFAKAVGVLWTPYRKIIQESSWFSEHFKMLDHYSEKYGKELYRNSTLYLTYFSKNLRFYPSGPRSSTLRGDSRIFGCIDELGLFPLPTGDQEEDENSERANADEAHKSLMNSLATVQSLNLKLIKQGYHSAPPCTLFCVSSPISRRDKVMRLLGESKTEEGAPYILGVNLPTWEVNPDMERDSPIIAASYASNWEKAERDFGANPPMVHSTYIKKATYEDGVFIGGQNSHSFKYEFDQPGEIYGSIEKLRTVKWPSLITLDAGHVNNSFIVVGGHYDFDTAKTVVSTIIECMPQENRRINFNLLYTNVILKLAKDLNAIAMLADQWQGIDLLYRIVADMGMNPLQKPRCLAKQYSPKRRDFNTTVTMMNNRNLILPTVAEQDRRLVLDGLVDNYRSDMLGKPVAHLMLQLGTVREVGELRCPEKGEGFTDDIFRALVLFASKIHEPAVMDRLKAAKDFNYSNGRSVMPEPIFAGRSGGMGVGFPNGLRQGIKQNMFSNGSED